MRLTLHDEVAFSITKYLAANVLMKMSLLNKKVEAR